MRHLVAVFLAVVILGLGGKSASASDVGYVIITSEDIEEISREWEKSIEVVISGARPRFLNYNTPEAEMWIEKLGMQFIPYVIFDKEIEQSERFFDLVRQGMIERRMAEYVIPENILLQSGVMFFKREKKEALLDIFIMSHDPGAKDSLYQISNFMKKNPGAMNVACHYIATFREFGIDSPHGPEGIKEDIRQLLIQKYYPDKFWGYLEKSREGKGFEAASAELGISASEIDLRREEGIALLEADFNLAKELGITASQTFVWENRVLFRSLVKLRAFVKPLNVSSSPSLLPGAKSEGPLPIIAFHRPECPHCQWLIGEYFPKLEQEFGSGIRVEAYDISVQENFEKKLKMEEEFGVLGAGQIPEIFVAGTVLIGRHEIEDNLRGIILKKNPSKSEAVRPAGEPGILIRRFKSFTPFAIAGAGLLDGINPCAFSTIIFFLSFLSLTGFSRREIILVGVSFTLAVFLTYLGLGIGAFAGLQRLRLFTVFSKYFDMAVAGLAIGLGIGSLYDYCLFKKTGQAKGMLLQLPSSIKNTIHKSMRSVKDKGSRRLIRLLMIAFSVGVLVSLLESMCTGQVYLPTLTFILKMKVMWWRALSFLLLYNLMFIVPLVVVFLGALAGVSSAWWARVLQQNLGKVKIATALFFFSIAAFIFLWN